MSRLASPGGFVFSIEARYNAHMSSILTDIEKYPLSAGQERYVQTISDTDLVHIADFDPKSFETAQALISEIQESLPEATIVHIGASALGLPGENDIDLGVVQEDKGHATQVLSALCGHPVLVDEKNALTRFATMRDGFAVEVFFTQELSGMTAEHVHNQEILKSDDTLRAKYTELKLASSGLTKRAYMKRKLQFFNMVVATLSTV